jgi:hypothetical protein
MKKIAAILINVKTLLIIYIVVSIITSFQSYFLPPKTFVEGGQEYTHYNNYIVFKQSHFHLLEGKDLYQLFPEEQWDLYKYSPGFALLFGAFAHLPDVAGLCLWNLINSLVLFLSIFLLPGINNKIRGLILLTVLIELITSLQNSQSNALVAGLIILGFGFMERQNYFLGTLWVSLSVFIKLFGIVALILLIFYPRKWKIALYLLLWSAILYFIPLLFVNWHQFNLLYANWMTLLSSDHSFSYGLSVMGWLKTWFNLEPNKIIVMLSGAIILCLPLIRIQLYKNYAFRLLTLASVLIWVIIFNHKSESPTFIIAMCGISIWFYTQPYSKTNLILLVLAILFVSLSPTDLFPVYIRNNFVIPYVLKVVPVMIIWGKIIFELGFGKKYFTISDNETDINPVS